MKVSSRSSRVDNWASFSLKLKISDCSVWKFQASFDLKDALYASPTAWKGIKGCRPMRNRNKTLAKCYVYDEFVKGGGV